MRTLQFPRTQNVDSGARYENKFAKRMFQLRRKNFAVNKNDLQ